MASFQPRGDKWRAIVRRKGFKPKSRTFPTKTAAKAWAERIERDLAMLEAQGRTEDTGLTVSQLIDWQDLELRTLKRITRTQRGNLTRLREGLGDVPVARLSAADVIAHARRRVTGAHKRGDGVQIPACSPATMNVELGYLSDLLRLGQAMGKIKLQHDPVLEARPALRMLRLVGKPKKRDRRPTEAELEKLRAHFTANRWRMQIPMADIMDFAILTAKREGEITRLLWDDVDEKHRTVLLRDVKHPRKKEGNHKRFPLLGQAWDIVQRQPRDAKRPEIFPYNSKSVGTAWRRACKDLRIEDLTFHDLRHEATSRLFEQGYSIEQVATVTLHESWNDLKRYTQLRPESLHR
jgi:integrase